MVHVAMPGSLNCDTTLPPKLDINVGARSHFFQSPSTPSASSSLHQSTFSPSTPSFDSSSSSRKRLRHDSLIANKDIRSSAASRGSLRAHSPPLFVETKYELAGGLDTPRTAALLAMDLREKGFNLSSDLHFRGDGRFRGFELTPDKHMQSCPLAMDRETHLRSRQPALRPARDGLERVIHSVVGVAGKVLEFCKATAFKGFYAGGGQGYQFKSVIPETNGYQSVWLDADRENACDDRKRGTGLVSDRFPPEDYIPDYMSQDHTTPPRAFKKIQREKGTGEISASWILVESTSSREASPSRLSHRKVPSTVVSTRRPFLKQGRRPILPTSRPSSTSYAGSPALQSDRPASFAFTRSPLSSPKHENPPNGKLQQHAAELRKRELQEGASLKRFNKQLKAMIKEGKEALGTKFEVHDEPTGKDCATGKS